MYAILEISLYTIIACVELRSCLPDTPCDRIWIQDQYYDKHILWKDLGRPYNLNVHRPTNTLFFSFSVPETYSDVDFQLVTVNIDTREYLNIPGIKGGCTTAIDEANDEIYLGGSDGIYKYNMATKLADLYKEKNRNIWCLFYRRNLFYVSYPDQRLYMEIDGKFKIVKEFQDFEIDQFYATRKGDIYFANSTGFYRYNKTKLRSEVIHDLLTVRQITEDINGVIYTCTNFGMFMLKKDGLVKISNLKNIYGVAFDKENNFVLSDDRRVMKLVKSNETCDLGDHW